MPRKLPWQKAVAEGPPSRKSSKIKDSPTSWTKRVASEREVDSDSTIQSEPRSKRRSHAKGREPSSSPPLVAPVKPPSVEFMNEGLEGDDRWIMVEDEFMSTAQSFTRHLHQAEYDRLKQLAKKRNTSAISDTTSPTSRHGASTESRLHQRSKALDKAQRDLLQPTSDDSDSGDDPWAANPHLASLVSKVRHPSAKLSQLAKIKSNTKASLGFVQPQGENKDLRKEQESTQHANPQSLDRVRSSHHDSFSKDSASTDNKRSAVKLEENAEDMHAPFQVSGISSTMAPSQFSERMARRRQDLAKRKKEEEKAISMDQVPTFLI